MNTWKFQQTIIHPACVAKKVCRKQIYIYVRVHIVWKNKFQSMGIYTAVLLLLFKMNHPMSNVLANRCGLEFCLSYKSFCFVVILGCGSSSFCFPGHGSSIYIWMCAWSFFSLSSFFLHECHFFPLCLLDGTKRSFLSFYTLSLVVVGSRLNNLDFTSPTSAGRNTRACKV